MTIKKHHVHYTFWSLLAIGVGVGLPWFFLGGVHTVSAFIAQKTSNQIQFENNEVAYINQAILVTNETASDITYTVTGTLTNIDAESYLVGDIETGDIILEKNQNVTYPIASISKLMTAIVAYDNLRI